MMNLFEMICFGVLTLTGVFVLTITSIYFWKKSKISTTVQVSCSSGDSEVMTFNYNFTEGEEAKSKSDKLSEAFSAIQGRRDYNHRRFLEIKEKALREKNDVEDESGALPQAELSPRDPPRAVN